MADPSPASEPQQAPDAERGARRVASRELRDAMAHLPTGVTVVTAMGPGGPSGLTANAVTSLSLDPPLMLACLDRGSRTLRSVEFAGRFGINVLGAGHASLAGAFGSKAAEPDKWEGVAWSERAAIPSLDDAVLWIACELEDVVGGGDHVIVTGAVVETEERGGDALVFWRGGYRAIDSER